MTCRKRLRKRLWRNIRVWLGAVALSACGTGCVGSLSGPRASDPRCIALDDARGNWAAAAGASAPLAGALGGVAALPGVSSEARLGLAGGAVAASAIATFAGIKGANVVEAWARECTEPPPDIVAPPPSYGARVVRR